MMVNFGRAKKINPINTLISVLMIFTDRLELSTTLQTHTVAVEGLERSLKIYSEEAKGSYRKISYRRGER